MIQIKMIIPGTIPGTWALTKAFVLEICYCCLFKDNSIVKSFVGGFVFRFDCDLPGTIPGLRFSMITFVLEDIAGCVLTIIKCNSLFAVMFT